MTGPDFDPHRMPPEDTAFVERLRGEFAPGPTQGERRTAFDAALALRIARARHPWLGAPVLAAAALTALLVWTLLPSAWAPSAPKPPGPVASLAETRAAADWEADLLDAVSFGEVEESDGTQSLPDDYAAIAAVLLEG